MCIDSINYAVSQVVVVLVLVVGNVPKPLIITRALRSCSRCVKGEGEIEKLQAKVVELRRKLDDTTAAMQELGRENQSLQVGCLEVLH